jgi:hypothetical protein
VVKRAKSSHQLGPQSTHTRPGLPWRVEMCRIGDLKPAVRNPRTHSEDQITLIVNSMIRYGFVVPAVVDRHNRIVAGHARYEAAGRAGLQWIPIIRLSDLSENELRAYALADNQIATKAGWNRELLAIELSELQIALPELGLDLGITGFDPGEVDAILEDFREGGIGGADDLPDPTEEPVVSRTGDLFLLGAHRLLVGTRATAVHMAN